MIQFNLLPDIKRDYVKARRTKRLTFLVAGLAAGISLLVLIIMFVVVQVLQKGYSSALSTDIQTEGNKLQQTPDINKILTIQNQLSSLTALHEKKPAATRLLGYVQQVTPAKVSIATTTVDFDANTINITGSADDGLASVNLFIDTLKFTTYQTDASSSSAAASGSAFTEVVLANFSKDGTRASYQVSLKYDPAIFAGNSTVKLIVPPGKITTRSETEKPAPLFQPLTTPAKAQ